MALLQPKITGDPVVDSWAAAVTRALNSGTLGGGGGNATTSASARNGNNGFNTATIYLFQRTDTDTAPTGIEMDSTYTYSSGELQSAVGGNTGDPTDPDDAIEGGWFRAIPEPTVQDGLFIWVTSVNIADTGNTEVIGPTVWFNPTLLSSPTEDVSLFISAREQIPGDNVDPANWTGPDFLNTQRASPNFKNGDADEVKGLVATVYIDGVEQDAQAFYDAVTTFEWARNGDSSYVPNQDQMVDPDDPDEFITGMDKRVILINEMDVDEDNANEIFTCTVTY